MLQVDGLSVLLMLLLGHVLGDFFLQPDSWVKDKNVRQGRSRFLYCHALVHGVIVLLILACATTTSLSASLFIGIIIALAHGVIDYAKIKIGRGFRWFLLDQFLHIVTLVFVWLYLYANAFSQLSLLADKVDYNHFFLITLAYVMMLKPASIVVGEILSKWSADLNTTGAITHDKKAESLTNAGQYLGYIERVLVLTFVLNGQYTAVGFVLAAKSIFRMGDLREAHDRKFTEYVMLGSLFSMSIALFTGFVIAKLLP
ncbi:DUF3307 domain-containing protein [Marinomonas spartinae]|uniref:DUF3307 domain-containing protein n=1 Tax=Marinomonas spartinae TaxID=1792290 RepID=UPI0018F1D72F|nr:DUF3307 domain-containing protein [Marinomonas spartinae]MBJ7555086.1 DUF3307 domain-containing protein [Marinomonas spartinae]